MVIFWSSLHFFSLMWLQCAVSWVFHRIRISSYNSVNKGYTWISGLKEAQNDRKLVDEWCMLSLMMQYFHKYTEYSHEIKNNEKLIKLPFWWYILLNTLQKTFSQNMPWYSKCFGDLLVVFFGGGLLQFFCLI